MSNTVYEKNGISFTRYWAGNDDAIQITIEGKYSSLSLEDLHEAVKAVEQSVEETKNAWWHKLKEAKQ